VAGTNLIDARAAPLRDELQQDATNGLADGIERPHKPHPATQDGPFGFRLLPEDGDAVEMRRQMIDNDIGKIALSNEKDDVVRLRLLAIAAVTAHGGEYARKPTLSDQGRGGIVNAGRTGGVAQMSTLAANEELKALGNDRSEN
jgi:hypothetical protein